MNKKIVVDYKKTYSSDGCVYNQTITLNKKFIKYINKNIKEYHNSPSDVKDILCKTIGFSKYYDCYLEELNLNKKNIFLTLTQLKYIYYYLSINNYNVKRILHRNTKLNIVE